MADKTSIRLLREERHRTIVKLDELVENTIALRTQVSENEDEIDTLRAEKAEIKADITKLKDGV